MTTMVACTGMPERQVYAGRDSATRVLTNEDQLLSERIAAEFARQTEKQKESLEHLVKAAMLSVDPHYAKQALRAALEQSENTVAYAMWSRWQELEPDSMQLRAWSVAIALQQGQSELAWQIVNDPEKVAVDNGELAEALAAVPVRERVLPFVERIVEASEQLAPAMRWSVFISRLNEPGVAIILASRLIDRFPKESAAYALRANFKRDQKDNAGAIVDYEKALSLDPQSRFLRLSLAQLEDARGNASVASKYVAEIAPQDDVVVQAYAAYAARSDDPKDLLAAYHALENLPMPRTGARLKMLGVVAELLGKKAQAVKWYREITGGPEQVDSTLRAAVLLGELQQSEVALRLIRDLRAAGILMREDLVNSYLIEGRLLSETAEYGQVLALYAGALRVLPDDSRLLYARAMQNAESGQIETAEQDLRKIIDLEPENADALNALGYTLADRTERLQEAMILIEKALRLKPDDPAILDSMGWVKFRLGKVTEAVGYLRAAYAKEKDSEVAMHLAEALWATKQHDEARRIWNEALKRDPSNKSLQNAIRRLGQ